MPNSNSITMPVATPIAKLTAKMRVQNSRHLVQTVRRSAGTSLQDDQHHAQADGQRREEVVEHDRQGKLNAREQNDVKFHKILLMRREK